MKNRIFLFSTILITTFSFAWNISAQDHTRWSLPDGAKLRLGKGLIENMKYSPDDTRLAVATSFGIWIYDTNTFKELALFSDSNYPYYANRIFSFSPDGNTLASTRGRGGIKLWDVNAGTFKKIPTNSLFSSDFILFSPDGQTFACIDYKDIQLWDVGSGESKHILKKHKEYLRSLSFSPDGQTLASGSKDHTICLWDVDTGEHKKTLTRHTASVTKLSFSPDGSTFTSVSDDKTVYLWDISTGERKRTFADQGLITEPLEPTEIIEELFFSPDGSTLATVELNNTIRLWDTTTGSLKQTFSSQDTDVTQTDYEKKIKTLLFSPDKRSVIGFTQGGTLRLWDIATGKHKQFADHTYYLRNICLSTDGKTLATAGMDHTIHLWDLTNLKHEKSIIGYYYRDYAGLIPDHTSISLSPDGSKVASINRNNTIFLCDTSTGQYQSLVTEAQKVIYLRGSNILFSPDSDTLVAANAEGIIQLWDANTGKYKHTLMTQQKAKASVYNPITISGVSFSPDGRTLANVSIDQERTKTTNVNKPGRTFTNVSNEHNIHLWNTTTGKLKGILKGHTNKINCVAFSPDGKTLVSGSQDRTLRLWDVVTGKHKQTISNPVKSIVGNSSNVSITAFSSDSATLASGNQDGSIYLWDVVTAKRKGTFNGHAGAISSITFSPDGLTLASTSMDGSIRLWDVETGQQKQAIAGYKKTNWRVFFYPNGLVLASKAASELASIGQENVQLWDLVTGERKKVLSGHAKNVSTLSFSADGKTLVSGSKDGTVLVWDMPSIINTFDFSEKYRHYKK